MGVIKTKLWNALAISMVEGILATRYGMELQGETCAKITILPGIMCRFNQNMYHKQLRENAGPHAASQEGNVGEEEEDNEIVKILQDVDDIFGEAVFLCVTNTPSACKY